MINSLLSKWTLLFCSFFILTAASLQAQKTVFSDNFNTSRGTAFTTSGKVGTSPWTLSRSGVDFGAKIDQGILTLTNDATSAGNSNGWVFANVPTSEFGLDYKTTLNQNDGIVAWSFNLRKLRSGNNGYNNGEYGVAYVLAGTSNTSARIGDGYAIRFLTTRSEGERIRLVRYVNGFSNQVTLLTSTDVGRENVSIRVEYNPATEEWSLFTRQDPTGVFTDPATGSIPFRLKETHNTGNNAQWNLSGSNNLTHSGAFWNAGTAANENGIFDNVKVTVAIPEITSINPTSKIAATGGFTMTVTGKNFTQNSKVQWNGQERTTTFVSATQLQAAITAADIGVSGSAAITVKRGTTSSNALTFTILPFGDPILTLPVTTLDQMQTVQGTASVAKTYTLRGDNLTAGATVSAPTNFELSINGTSWSDQLTLPNTGGGLTDQPITIRVRIKANAPVGIYESTITHNSTGAGTKKVSVSGKVLAIQPNVAAKTVTFTNITSTSFKINWINGNGAQRLVLVKKASAVNVFPTDGITYEGNTVFKIGSDLGQENYAVYKGTDDSVSVTGLEPNTVYHASVIEFNGADDVENYLLPGAIANTKTKISPVGFQLNKTDTSYKIDFDQTVDGVNVDAFKGDGIRKEAESGQLDSDAWAFSGFAAGDLAYGADSVDGTSYERGSSTGIVQDPGIYGFNVGASTENFALGIKPGGTDFNPGSITLKIQNKTGVALTSLNIGYKVYVNNVEGNATKVGFAYSNNDSAYQSVPSVDVTSPTTADNDPRWKASYRVATVPASVPVDGYYYIRWSGSSVPTTGNKDEFALDDIEVIANPTTSKASFNGVAEDFLLSGNAGLSGNLTVKNKLQFFNDAKLSIQSNTLTTEGKVSSTTGGGLLGSATSKVVVTGKDNPTLRFVASNRILQSLSLLGTQENKITLASPLSVNDLLEVNEFETLDLGTNELTGTLTSIINNGTITTQNTSVNPFPADKTWNGTGLLHLNGAAAQTLVSGTYNNLRLSAIAGTTATGNSTVNGTLDLPSANASATRGSLHMGTHTLTMGAEGSNTGLGEVTGIITRNTIAAGKLYTFGHPNSSVLFQNAGTLPTALSAKLTIGSVPAWRTGAINRQFDIIQTGAALTKALIRMHYLDTEINSNSESKLVFWGNRVNTPPSDPSLIFEQGRSNNNTTDNWVEITNADIGLYFQSTFDKVYITLDETEAADLKWNGSESTSWITAANWTKSTGGTGVPSAESKVIIPNITETFNRSPKIDENAIVKSITIEEGGIVDALENAKLTVHDGAGAWQNNGILNPGTSEVVFINPNATIAGTTTFNNITIAPLASLRALEGSSMIVKGAFTNNGVTSFTLLPNTLEFTGIGQTVPLTGGSAQNGFYSLKLSGSGTTIATNDLNIRGDLMLNESVSFVGKTVNLTGIVDQTIGGTAAINFNNLIINKPTNKVILSQDIKIAGTLSLQSGRIVLGTKNLTLGASPVAGTFNVDNMIVADGAGKVIRPVNSIGEYFFPIGDLTSVPAYSPIKVNITAGTFAPDSSVEVNVKNEKHPSNKSSANFLSRYWNVKQTGITGAVATINANYVSSDIIGTEENIAAAQLRGQFDVSTNPWIKFGSLGSNTLLAEGVTLFNKGTSVFTGIKGGDFKAEIFGYGDFCQNSTVELSAVTEGGDGPFTYTWTQGETVLTDNTAALPVNTAATGSFLYSLSVRDANGFIATDTGKEVYIFPASEGGTIDLPAQDICLGSKPADLKLVGSVGRVSYWQRSTTNDFSVFTNIANYTTTLSGNDIGSLYETTYFRAVLQSGDCDEKMSTVAVVTVRSTTWNGTGWSNGSPDASTTAIFQADYTSPADSALTMCNMIVENNFTITIPAGTSMTIQNNITNNGNIIVESDGNLIQVNDNGTYTGDPAAFKVQRTANIKRLDYVYWSSPVAGQKLKAFSPGTLDNRFLTYSEAPNLFVTLPDVNVNFEPGKGYAIRASNRQSSTAVNWTGDFVGSPNNGKITFELQKSALADGYNLIGNPYPSNIDFHALVATGAINGTAYFWTNVYPTPETQLGSGYDGSNYATYNLSGGVSSTNGPIAPERYIKVGQGFVVQAAQPATLTFTNAMRNDGTGPSKFLNKGTANNNDSIDRFWLKLITPAQNFNTILIAYPQGATNGFDSFADAKQFGESSDSFYTILNDYKLNIQGRQFPLVKSDVVPVGMKGFETGEYKIAMVLKEGIFANGQNIYLRDNQTNTLTNLSIGDYTFEANAGLTEGRFEITYQTDNVLGTDNTKKDELVVYREGSDFIVKSAKNKISELEVYDTSGRLMIKLKPNETEVRIAGQSMINGVYILKINQNGKITTRKIIR